MHQDSDRTALYMGWMQIMRSADICGAFRLVDYVRGTWDTCNIICVIQYDTYSMSHALVSKSSKMYFGCVKKTLDS